MHSLVGSIGCSVSFTRCSRNSVLSIFAISENVFDFMVYWPLIYFILEYTLTCSNNLCKCIIFFSSVLHFSVFSFSFFLFCIKSQSHKTSDVCVFSFTVLSNVLPLRNTQNTPQLISQKIYFSNNGNNKIIIALQ